jgi:putative DNA primase/helicase
MQSLRSLAAALGGNIAGRNSVLCPGPGHSRKDRSLKVAFRDDGTFTVTSFADDDWRQCKDYVRERLGLPSDWIQPVNNNPPVIRLREHDDDEYRKRTTRDGLLRWKSAVPIAGTLAEHYLSSRGLAYSGDALRYRANDRTMLAQMTDSVTGEPRGVQAIYLDKEARKIERKMRGPSGGAVIRLSPDDAVEYGLAIGEGVETCLATGFEPIWATLNAGNMAAFPLLSGIDCLTIFADNDKSGTGLAAAKTCAERWHAADREAIIHIPAIAGVDFATMKEVA